MPGQNSYIRVCASVRSCIDLLLTISNMPEVLITVLRRANLADTGSRHLSCIQADATLADVRAVLLADDIMKEGDRFYLGNAAIGKSVEATRKFVDLNLKVRSITSCGGTVACYRGYTTCLVG